MCVRVRVRVTARIRIRARARARARVRIRVRLGVGVRARVSVRVRVIERRLNYLGIVAEDGGFEEVDLRALLTQLRVERAQLVVELHERALGSALLLSQLSAPPP